MSNSASLDQYRDLLLAAWLYANTRSEADRSLMLAVGSNAWDGFPQFLVEMKQAIQNGRSKDFLKHNDVKHMYGLLFVSIMNGLDSDYLNKVGGALLAATSKGKTRPAKQARREERVF